MLSDVEFKQLFSNSSAVNFSGVVFRIPEGKRVRDAKIFVNLDDFVVDGENFSDHIEISIMHEAAEMYIYAKLGYSLLPALPA